MSIPDYIICLECESPLYTFEWKKEKIGQIILLLKGALRAENMVGLKMNVSEKDLEEVISILPSLNAPTIAGL